MHGEIARSRNVQKGNFGPFEGMAFIGLDFMPLV